MGGVSAGALRIPAVRHGDERSTLPERPAASAVQASVRNSWRSGFPNSMECFETQPSRSTANASHQAGREPRKAWTF